MISWQIRRFGVRSLYYMLPIDNLPQILSLGILSYNKAKSPHRNFADKFVQRRRNRRIAVLGKQVHDFVPLYFTTCTPMQYVLTQGSRRRVKQEDLIFIELDPIRVFELAGVVFTDGNAAADATNVFRDLNDLNNLDWHVIHKVRNCYSKEFRRKKAAEVLVPDSVPVRCFSRVVVFDHLVMEKLKEGGCSSEIDRSLYYPQGI